MDKITNFNNFKIQTSTNKNQTNSNEVKVELTQKPDEIVLNTAKNKKKLSTKQKVLIGIGATLALLGTVGSVLLFTKSGKLKPAKFSEYIEFKPAETMEEAKRFAQENFKIKNYDLEDNLDVANWLNEGLTNLNNQFKGKAHMPRSVAFSKQLKENTPASMTPIFDELMLSKELYCKDLETARQEVEEAIKLVYFVKDGKEIFRPFNGLNSKALSGAISEYKRLMGDKNAKAIDWINLSLRLEDIAVAQTHPAHVLSELSKNEKCMEILKEENIPFNLAELYAKTKEEQKEFLKNIFAIINQKTKQCFHTNAPCRFDNPFNVIYHELGHLQQYKNRSFYSLIFKDLIDPNFTKDFSKQQIAQKISWYAQTSPDEFVAEIFTQMCNGKRIPDDAMDLYEKYYGACL